MPEIMKNFDLLLYNISDIFIDVLVYLGSPMEWPKWARRIFICTLPLSLPLLIATVITYILLGGFITAWVIIILALIVKTYYFVSRAW